MNEDFELFKNVKNNLNKKEQKEIDRSVENKNRVINFFESNDTAIYEAIKYAALYQSKRGEIDITIVITALTGGSLELKIGEAESLFIRTLYADKEIIRYTAKRMNKFLSSLKSIKFKIPAWSCTKEIGKNLKDNYYLYYPIEIKGV